MEYSNEAINLVEQVLNENLKDTIYNIKDNFEKRQALNTLTKTMRYKPPKPLTAEEKRKRDIQDRKIILQNKLNKVGRDGMTVDELKELRILNTKHEAAMILIEALNTLLNE